MKKRFLVLALMGAFAMTALSGCGKDKEPDTKSESEKDDDKDDDKDEDVPDRSGSRNEDTQDVEFDVDIEAYMEGLVGIWVEQDAMDPWVLSVYYEDGEYCYELAYEGGGAQYGTVDLTYEDHPDGSVSFWYTFYDVDGDEWESFAVDEDDYYPDDIYSGQDGALHFARTTDFDSENQGMGDIQPYFFVGDWQSPDCSMTVTDVGDGYYQVDIVWPEDAYESYEWTYICAFDEDSEFLFCDDGSCYDVIVDDDGDIVSLEEVYNDGSAIFYFDNDGLHWGDYKDQSNQELVFEYIGG